MVAWFDVGLHQATILIFHHVWWAAYVFYSRSFLYLVDIDSACIFFFFLFMHVHSLLLYFPSGKHSKWSEANNRGLFEISRYICLSALHCTRPCTPYTSSITSAHCALSFETLAAVQSTTLRSRLSLGIANSAKFSWRQPRRRQRLKSYAYNYWTQEAQLKLECSTEEEMIGSRTILAYSFLYYFFILYMYLSIYIISLL